MNKRISKEVFQVFAIFAIMLLCCVISALSQSTNRISAPCPASLSRAEFKIEKGELILNPCPSKNVKVNGTIYNSGGVAFEDSARTNFLSYFKTENALGKSPLQVFQAGAEKGLRWQNTEFGNFTGELYAGITLAGTNPNDTNDNLFSFSLEESRLYSRTATFEFAAYAGSTEKASIIAYNEGNLVNTASNIFAVNSPTFQVNSNSIRLNGRPTLSVASGCSGSGTIVSVNKALVETPCMISANSQVYVTANAPEALWVSDKEPGSFLVNCIDGSCVNIPFTYFVVNTY